jgi:hypothetical protein
MIDTPATSDSAWGPAPAEQISSAAQHAKSASKRRNRRWMLIVGAVGLLAVAAAGGWLGVRHFTKSSAKSDVTAVGVSRSGLTTIAGSLGRPIYWAGARSGVKYELTVAPDGRMYVRYLPTGVAVGTKTRYLTIGTYPFSNALAVTTRVAHQKGSVVVPAPSGAIAFYRKAIPTNVFVAFPGSSYQIEVYDPSATAARKIVSGGLISTVVATSNNSTAAHGTAIVTSPASLKALSAKLGTPIYWAGQVSGTSEVLTQTPDGRIYVRYVPKGVAPGSTTPYLTIATYPVKNAYATSKAATKRADVVKVPLSSGNGIAFYVKSHPTSVYLAFPGTNEQIEVFDPSASHARQLVASQQIHPVS